MPRLVEQDVDPAGEHDGRRDPEAAVLRLAPDLDASRAKVVDDVVGGASRPIRKHWAWLGTKGSTRHWLDIHVLMGLTAPFIVAFHSTLKFRGIAGMAFWIMFAVSTSGVVGRYLYAQIPRKVTTAELSMKELQELQENLAHQLAAQNLLPVADLRALLRMPDANRVSRLPIVVALIYMMILDVIRLFRVARLRRPAVQVRPAADR